MNYDKQRNNHLQITPKQGPHQKKYFRTLE